MVFKFAILIVLRTYLQKQQILFRCKVTNSFSFRQIFSLYFYSYC